MMNNAHAIWLKDSRGEKRKVELEFLVKVLGERFARKLCLRILRRCSQIQQACNQQVYE